ncbi:MAG: tetratricopeptide repeat protein, partial [Armatimonadota bacterium]
MTECEALERFRLLTDAFRPGDFDPAVLMRLGAAAESRGENEPAVAAWMAAAQAHPDSPQAAPAALRAARVFLRHDSPERAAAVLELIQRRWPDTEEALTATSLLREVWRGGET